VTAWYAGQEGTAWYAGIYLFIYFISLHVSSITVLIIRRSNCINTSSGMTGICQ